MAGTKASVNRGSKSRQVINSETKVDRLRLSEARNILNVTNLDPARHYRWVTDKNAGRDLYIMGRRGYKHETDWNLIIGDKNAARAEGEGSLVRIVSGTNADGNLQYSYLMSVKKEWHEEDKEDFAAEVAEKEMTIMDPDLDPDDEEAVADYVARSGHDMTQHTANAKPKGKRKGRQRIR